MVIAMQETGYEDGIHVGGKRQEIIGNFSFIQFSSYIAS